MNLTNILFFSEKTLAEHIGSTTKSAHRKAAVKAILKVITKRVYHVQVNVILRYPNGGQIKVM